MVHEESCAAHFCGWEDVRRLNRAFEQAWRFTAENLDVWDASNKLADLPHPTPDPGLREAVARIIMPHAFDINGPHADDSTPKMRDREWALTKADAIMRLIAGGR